MRRSPKLPSQYRSASGMSETKSLRLAWVFPKRARWFEIQQVELSGEGVWTIEVGGFLGASGLWDVTARETVFGPEDQMSQEIHYVVRKARFTLACEIGEGEIQRVKRRPLTWTVTTAAQSNFQTDEVKTYTLGAKGSCVSR